MGLQLTPLHVPAAYQHVVAHLHRAIWLGELIPGERLPAERALADGLGVSRLTVREALRTLQGEGLIVIRRGASGGATVASKEMTTVQHHRLLVESRDEMRNVHEVRHGIEPMSARLAAERITTEQLDALRSHQRDLLASAGVPEFRRADTAFHMAIAYSSGNALLAKVVEDARSALFTTLDSQDFEVLRTSSAEAHGRILDAIAGGDGAHAALAMSAHLDEAWAEILAVIDAPPRLE